MAEGVDDRVVGGRRLGEHHRYHRQIRRHQLLLVRHDHAEQADDGVWGPRTQERSDGHGRYFGRLDLRLLLLVLLGHRGAHALRRRLELLVVREHGGHDALVAEHDHTHRKDEAEDVQARHEADVVDRLGKVVEGAFGLQSLGDVVAPAEERRRRPQGRPEPDQEDHARRSPLRHSLGGAQRFRDDVVTVDGDDGQRVDRHQAENAADETVELAAFTVIRQQAITFLKL